MSENITTQVKRLSDKAFLINATIKGNNGYGDNTFRCPSCKNTHIRVNADMKGIRLYCIKCYWEENYKRILKKGENEI